MKYFPEFKPSDKSNFIDLYREGFDRYCRQLADYYGCLNNQGLALLDDDADTDQGNAFIDDLFVLPSFGSNASNAENFDTEQQALQAKDNISAAKLLAAKPRQFILGDPGIGKTTFLHWLAISLAHHRSNFVQQAIGPLLPILLRVRDFRAYLTAPCDSKQFIAHLKSYLGSLGELLEKNSLVQAMANGQVLLLVDGLDEIGKQEMLNLGQTLASLFSEYPSCRCIMTARVVGFDASLLWPISKNNKKEQLLESLELNEVDELETDASSEPNTKQIDPIMHNRNRNVSQLHDFGLYYIQPLNNEQRLKFSDKWCKIYVKAIDAQAQFIKDLQAAFNENGSLNNLSRTPVLLNMICFIQQRRGRLPNGRAELYQKIIETYLVSMDRARGIENNFIDSEDFDYTDIRNWLAKLAYVMQLGKLAEFIDNADGSIQLEDLCFDSEVPRNTSLTESELTRFFTMELEEVYENKDKCAQTAQKLIDYIKRRTGFLIDRGQDAELEHETVFAFSHLSFQEYFAAHFISQQWSQLSQKAELVHSLTLSCNSQSWFECWQLVFEDYSQNGNSRQQHSQFIDKLFGSVEKLAELFPEINDVFGDKADHAVHLLSKIILNPAVKFPPNYRQKQVTELWIYNFGRSQHAGSSSIYTLWPELCRDYDVEDSLNRKAINTAFDRFNQKQAINLDLSGVKSADLRPLKLWPELRTLDLSNTQIDNLQPLEEFKHLNWLEFTNTSVSDLTPITKLKELRGMLFSNTGVVDLTPLTKLTKLESLIFSKTAVADLKPLAGLKRLRQLNLSGTKVTDLLPITDLTRLETLICNNTDIAELTLLSKLSDLQRLMLNSTQVSDLTPLANIPNLRLLGVSQTAVSKLTPLAKFKKLIHLDISHTQVTDLTPLAKMCNLLSLELHNTNILDLTPLEKLTELRRLNISHTQVTDLTPLNRLPQPILVRAIGCVLLDMASLKSLPEHIRVIT